MNITKVEPLSADRFCFVRIEADEGLRLRKKNVR
jgi:hypothetical protein